MLEMFVREAFYLHPSGKNKVSGENSFLMEDQKLLSGTSSSSCGQEDFSFNGKIQQIFGKVDVQLSLETLLKGKKCVFVGGDHMCREVSY